MRERPVAAAVFVFFIVLVGVSVLYIFIFLLWFFWELCGDGVGRRMEKLALGALMVGCVH